MNDGNYDYNKMPVLAGPVEYTTVANNNEISQVEYCPICELSFPSLELARQHIKQSNCEDKLQKCITFAKILEINCVPLEKVANQESDCTHQCVFKCTLCGKPQEDLVLTDTKNSEIPEPKEKTLITNKTPDVTRKLALRARHRATRKVVAPESRVKTPCPRTCKICGKILKRGQLKLHMKKRHGISNAEPSASTFSDCELNFENLLDIFNKSGTDTTNLDETNCNVCGEKFSSVELLKDHMQTSECRKPSDSPAIIIVSEDPSGDGPYRYKCTICERTYSLRENCKRHMLVHSGRKAKCDICGKEFSEGRYIKDHMRSHSEEKPFQCHICGAAFKTNQGVKGHLRTHAGEKSYKCTVCGKAFAHRSGLNTHKRAHTGEHYLCQVCGKRFTYGPNFQRHKRIHSGSKPYVCSVCDKAFTQSGALKVHMRIHSGEKPYVCHYCGKAFTENGTLKAHLVTHTGEKAYTCTVCGKGFSQRGGLNVHMASHNSSMIS